MITPLPLRCRVDYLPRCRIALCHRACNCRDSTTHLPRSLFRFLFVGLPALPDGLPFPLFLLWLRPPVVAGDKRLLPVCVTLPYDLRACSAFLPQRAVRTTCWQQLPANDLIPYSVSASCSPACAATVDTLERWRLAERCCRTRAVCRGSAEQPRLPLPLRAATITYLPLPCLTFRFRRVSHTLRIAFCLDLLQRRLSATFVPYWIKTAPALFVYLLCLVAVHNHLLPPPLPGFLVCLVSASLRAVLVLPFVVFGFLLPPSSSSPTVRAPRRYDPTAALLPAPCRVVPRNAPCRVALSELYRTATTTVATSVLLPFAVPVLPARSATFC